MKKTTGELMEILAKNKNIDSYLKANEDELSDCSLTDFLAALLDEKGVTKAEVISRSGINTVYAYQIFSGLKKPSRDRLIQLAFGFGLDIEQTQRLLKIGGGSALYPRNKRDSIIISAVCNNKSVIECDEMLYDRGEKMISSDVK